MHTILRSVTPTSVGTFNSQCYRSKAMPSDDFRNAVRELLAKRVAVRCSNPGCARNTSGPRSDPNQSITIGVAAHISAASLGGPRYDSSMTTEERRSVENGIWLCQSCSKLIDSDSALYTVETLRNWKRGAEETARTAIEMPSSSKETEPCSFVELCRLFIPMLQTTRGFVASD